MVTYVCTGTGCFLCSCVLIVIQERFTIWCWVWPGTAKLPRVSYVIIIMSDSASLKEYFRPPLTP